MLVSPVPPLVPESSGTKGAVDGGVAVPHSESRFVGTDEETKELDAEVLRNYIFANHVSEYMEYLREEDPELYKQQFSVYIKSGLTIDNLEDKWTECHAEIRANPLKTRLTGEKKKYNQIVKGKRGKMSRQQKADRIKQKLTAWKKKMAADDAE